MNTFNGARMRKVRCKLKISGTGLAKDLRVSRQTINSWENGSAEPTLANLRALALKLGVSADYLLSPDP